MSDENNWEGLKKPGCIILIGFILLAIFLLMWKCDGARNLVGYGDNDGGDKAEKYSDLLVPDGCDIINHEDHIEVICPEDECLTEETYRAVYTELLCNPPECKKPTPTRTVTPPKKPCKGKDCKKKTSCADYAKKTGKPYKCMDPKPYRKYRGNKIRHGLCSGALKCMIPGKPREGAPPPGSYSGRNRRWNRSGGVFL